ncbi:McrC family protein [Evansella tamaricis]|uniref:McrC family protein n=1 Tax=Evansella tamaricis TaxID=2069301 RepID=A0ABS6JLC4_9BACI|nr:McrC family protein [Evansella tamaricis]MBU9713225.1 McrC family protein [Evansella tamaricis]
MMNTKTVISLKEYEQVQDVYLPPQTTRILKNDYSHVFHLSPSGLDHYHLTAKSMIGLVNCEDHLFQIEPKMKTPIIWDWLAVAYDLKSLEWDWSRVGFASSFGDMEWVVKSFIKECQRIYSRGIKKGNVQKEEPIAAVRGSLNATQTFHRWLKYDYRFECRFDELTEDVNENRIIAATLSAMLVHSYHDSNIRGDLRSLLQIYGKEINQSISNLFDPSLWIREIQQLPLNRTNAHYHRGIQWAFLYWKTTSLDFSLGHVQSHSFLLDMNELFELYISKRLTTELRPYGIQVIQQKYDYLAEMGRIRIIPDVLLKTPSGREIVLDLKYILKRDAASINSNIFQMLAYLTARKAKHGILLYAGGKERTDHIKNSNFTVHQWSMELDKENGAELVEARMKELAERLVKLW